MSGLSRGDKQKQTNWPKSATRAKVLEKSEPLVRMTDAGISADDRATFLGAADIGAHTKFISMCRAVSAEIAAHAVVEEDL